MEKQFKETIFDALQKKYKNNAKDIFDKSSLLQYIELKTRSADKGSKSRSNFASLYALYVLIEDYITKVFIEGINYSKYEGAEFSKLLLRQRELPFGSKLQNHALNNRLNSEFEKYFPQTNLMPIIRDEKKYWINDILLNVQIKNKSINISRTVIDVLNLYIQSKQDNFAKFIKTCSELQNITQKNNDEVEEFISGLLAPNVDARIFEIISYAILKYHYHDQTIYWGYDIQNLNTDYLRLYKTGRTNANDGGIDYVMKPLGRFFQVTETLDIRKYFLDIEKIQRYPITFVIKSEEQVSKIFKKIETSAYKQLSIKSVVRKYMDCIEEIINIGLLREYFAKSIKQDHLKDILNEIIIQSKVEFNQDENEEEEEE